MTWDPDVDPHVIDSFRIHLDENTFLPYKTINQVIEAAEYWRRMASECSSNITVRTYKSSPTMQGYFIGGPNAWGVIELYPFATQPNDRPALLLTVKNDPDVFALFRNAFEDLWNRNEPSLSPARPQR